MRKVLIGGMALICVAWSTYVAINIISTRINFTPDTIFNLPGENIVIVHKGEPREFSATEFAGLKRSPLYERILANQERIQHFYFSGSRDLAILERSKPWTAQLVKRYFAALGMVERLTGSRTYALNDGWNARFDSHFLTFYKSSPGLSDKSLIDWKYLDKKSAATLIEWNGEQPRLVNCYFSDNGLIRFVSISGSATGRLVNDAEVFADVIPADVNSYEFYEKSYFSDSFGAGDFAEMAANGFVLVEKDGELCLIFDIISSVDPIAVLGEAIDETSVNNERTEASLKNSLTKLFPNEQSLHLRVFNNRVFLSNHPHAVDWCIGSYETGNTLLQDAEKYRSLYAVSPAAVSHRKVDERSKITLSFLQGSTYETLVMIEVQSNKVSDRRTAAPVRIPGGLRTILPATNSSMVFVVSKESKLYAVDLEGKSSVLTENIMGDPVITEDGELLVTTRNAIHKFSKIGTETPGFPVQCGSPARSAAISYSWKNKNGLILATDAGIEHIIPAENKRQIIPVNNVPGPHAPVVWVSGGKLLATFTSSAEVITFDVGKKRVMQRFPASGSLTLLKVNKQPVLAQHSNSQMKLLNSANQAIGSTMNGNVVGSAHFSQNAPVYIYGNSRLQRVDGTGNPGIGIQTGFIAEWVSATVNSRFAILDGISNKVYLYRENGTPYSTETFSGSELAELHVDSRGKLWLLTVSNGYLVRYPIK